MENEFEKVKGAFEDFGKKVVEAVKKGKGEADKVTKIAQVKIEIGSLNREKKDLFTELGELFYRNYKKPGKGSQDEIAEAVTHVTEVEKKIAGLNRQLKAVRQEKPAVKRGRPPRKAAAGKAGGTKRRGRPPKATTTGGETSAPKRRGRPPKPKAE